VTVLLGIDVGQTIIKASLYDAHGRSLGTGSQLTPTFATQPNWQERDMTALWRCTAATIRQALADSGVQAQQVAAVGVSGHGDGLHLVDRAGDPTRPAITATDARATSYAERFRATSIAGQALRLTGQEPAAYSQACLLNWVREHEPDVFHRSQWALFSKDWIRYKLTGEIATDPTDASSAFTDVHTGAYSDAALALFGLADAAQLLPPMLRTCDIAGLVHAEGSEATGLQAGTPVITGCHDVDAAAVGVGATETRSASAVMGTFSINQVVADRPELDGRWQARRYVEDGTWLHISSSPAGTATLDWLVRTTSGQRSVSGAELSAAVAEALALPEDRRPPLFLPFLFGAPFAGAEGGALLDLRGGHTRAELTRAGLMGISFVHRWHLDALAESFPQERPLRVTGGGTRSAGWTQLLADVTGRVVEVTDNSEASSQGAAMLAGVGAGTYSNIAEAVRRCVRVLRVHEPDRQRSKPLDEAYQRWLAAARAVISL
jgi:L-xylulokinase